MSSSIILDVEVDEARRQCFIEIHRSAYDKLGFTNKGLSIASVEWNEHFSTKEHKKVYVGINRCFDNGSRNVMRIGPHYCACLGLKQGQRVTLHPIRDYPEEFKLTNFLELRPADPSDWEVAELQSHVIQEKLLYQIQVLTLNTRFPIWVFENGQPIHFVTSLMPNCQLPSNMPPFFVLQDGAELSVAPAIRAKASQASGDTIKSITSNSKLYTELTIKTLQSSLRNSALDNTNIATHPCTLNKCPCLPEIGFESDNSPHSFPGCPSKWEALVNHEDLSSSLIRPKRGALWLRTTTGDSVSACIVSVTPCHRVHRGTICLPIKLLSIYGWTVGSPLVVDTPRLSLAPPICVISVIEHVPPHSAANSAPYTCPKFAPQGLAGVRKLPSHIRDAIRGSLATENMTLWDGACIPLHYPPSLYSTETPSSSVPTTENLIAAVMAHNTNIISPSPCNSHHLLDEIASTPPRSQLNSVSCECGRSHSYPFAIVSFASPSQLPAPPPPAPPLPSSNSASVSSISSQSESESDMDEPELEDSFPWPAEAAPLSFLERTLIWQGWFAGRSSALPLSLRDALVRATIGSMAERHDSVHAEAVRASVLEMERVIASSAEHSPPSLLPSKHDPYPFLFSSDIPLQVIISPVIIPLHLPPQLLSLSPPSPPAVSGVSTLLPLLLPVSLLPHATSLPDVFSVHPSRGYSYLRSCLTAPSSLSPSDFTSAISPPDASLCPVSLATFSDLSIHNVTDKVLSDMRDDSVGRELLRLLRTNAVSILHSPITPSTSPLHSRTVSLLNMMASLSAFNSPLSNLRRLLESASKICPVASLSLSTGPPRILLAGSRGCGKSSLMQALLEENFCFRDVPSISLSCGALSTALSGDGLMTRGAAVVTAIETIIRGVFHFAESKRGCVVFLDDLDKLLPSPSDDHQAAGGGDATAIRGISVLLETGMSFLRQTAVVIASVQSAEALHPCMRTRQTFAAVSCGISNLTFNDRFNVIKHLVNSEDEEDLLRSAARESEGFVLADLAGAFRRISSFDIILKKKISTAEALLASIKNYVPTSLQAAGQSNLQAAVSSANSWSDIGGSQTIRQSLQALLELPKKFSVLCELSGISCPQGGFLIGPPGSGKSLLARIGVRESGMRLFVVKGPELLSKYIGGSEAAVREIFSRASKSSPSVILFDEIESLAPKRGADSTGVTDRVVNQLLTFLDGVEGRDGVVVLGATSRPDLVDPALLRPGRLESLMLCTYPSTPDEIEDILKVAFKGLPCDENVQLNTAARTLAEKSFADIPQNESDTINTKKIGGIFSQADIAAIASASHITAVHRLISNTKIPNEESKFAGNLSPQLIITMDDIMIAVEEARPSLDGASLKRYLSIYRPLVGGEDAARLSHLEMVLGNVSNNGFQRKKQRVALA